MSFKKLGFTFSLLNLFANSLPSKNFVIIPICSNFLSSGSIFNASITASSETTNFLRYVSNSANSFTKSVTLLRSGYFSFFFFFFVI